MHTILLNSRTDTHTLMAEAACNVLLIRRNLWFSIEGTDVPLKGYDSVKVLPAPVEELLKPGLVLPS